MENKCDALVCTQCGSVNIKITAQDEGLCENCGAKILLNKEKAPIIINNNIDVVQNIDNKIKDFELNYATIKSEISADEFLRETFYKFAIDKKIGASIYESEFLPVEKEYDKFTIADGKAKIDYSVSIGYNKTVKETKRNAITGKNETFSKIVTEWQAHSGKNSKDCKVGLVNGEYTKGQEKKIIDEIKGCTILTLAEVNESNCKPYEITEEHQKAIKEALIYKCAEKTKETLPGDTYKRFSYSGTAQIDKLNCFLLPKYTLKFKNEEKEHIISENAYGQRSEKISVKTYDVESVWKKFMKKTQYFWMLAVLLYVIGVVLGEFIPQVPSIPIIFSMIAILFCGVLLVFMIIEINKYTKENQLLKKEKFIKMTEKYNLRKATTEELLKIERK